MGTCVFITGIIFAGSLNVILISLEVFVSADLAQGSSDVAIVGAGPAGMILALLLARRGLSVKSYRAEP